jgi:hypothetical protein
MEPASSSRRTFSARRSLPPLYHREMAEAWTRAAESAGSLSSADYIIAGKTFRLIFAGSRLAALLGPALAHLTCPPVKKPDLVIHAWDESVHPGGVPLPDEDVRVDYREHHLRFLSDDRFSAFYEEWLGTLSALDVTEGNAYYCCLDSASLPLYETTAPFRTLLGNWLNRFDLQVVHAATIGRPEGALLLAGPGGSGKSSTALLALQNGLSYLSDDLCVVASTPRPFAYSLYNTAKLRADSLSRFPEIAQRMQRYQECGEEKAILFLHHEWPEKLLKAAPIQALLLPQVAHQPETHITPSNWNEALRALAPWSLRQVPGSGKKSVDLMFRFVAQLPAQSLRLGTDPDGILQHLKNLLPAAKGGA